MYVCSRQSVWMSFGASQPRQARHAAANSPFRSSLSQSNEVVSTAASSTRGSLSGTMAARQTNVWIRLCCTVIALQWVVDLQRCCELLVGVCLGMFGDDLRRCVGKSDLKCGSAAFRRKKDSVREPTRRRGAFCEGPGLPGLLCMCLG